MIIETLKVVLACGRKTLKAIEGSILAKLKKIKNKQQIKKNKKKKKKKNEF